MLSPEGRAIIGPDSRPYLESENVRLLQEPIFGVSQFADFVGNMGYLVESRLDPLSSFADVKPVLTDWANKRDIEFHYDGEGSSIRITPYKNSKGKYDYGKPSQRVSFQKRDGSEEFKAIVSYAYTVEMQKDISWDDYVSGKLEPVFPKGEFTNGGHRIMSTEELQNFCERLQSLYSYDPY